MTQNLSAFITGVGSTSPVGMYLGASSLRLYGFGSRGLKSLVFAHTDRDSPETLMEEESYVISAPDPHMGRLCQFSWVQGVGPCHVYNMSAIHLSLKPFRVTQDDLIGIFLTQSHLRILFY